MCKRGGEKKKRSGFIVCFLDFNWCEMTSLEFCRMLL